MFTYLLIGNSVTSIDHQLLVVHQIQVGCNLSKVGAEFSLIDHKVLLASQQESLWSP